jgi:hypothetical protein
MTAQKNQSFIAVVANGIGNGLTEFSGYGIKTSARASARALGTKKEEKSGGNYSTVKSAQRLSATLSIRPRGRLQIIDI